MRGAASWWMSLASGTLLLASGCAPAPSQPVSIGAPPEHGPPVADPALRLHGHNDYLQPVPLRRALELGLGSLEADVYPVGDELQIGHERWQLRAGRTLRSIYLEPLRAEVERRGGVLRGDGRPLVLLVDIKTGGAEAWRLLRSELADFAPMLTRFADGRVEPGAVTVLLSGDRPRALVAREHERLCALDGRLADLAAAVPPPPDLVPWISDTWRKVSDWSGSDELMADEVERVRALVQKAHSQGRELRFWSAPDRVEGWRALFDLGVDHISTDLPAKAAEFLRGEDLAWRLRSLPDRRSEGRRTAERNQQMRMAVRRFVGEGPFLTLGHGTVVAVHGDRVAVRVADEPAGVPLTAGKLLIVYRDTGYVAEHYAVESDGGLALAVPVFLRPGSRAAVGDRVMWSEEFPHRYLSHYLTLTSRFAGLHEPMKVLPEVGLDTSTHGALRFGMSRDEVRAAFGEPDQVIGDGDEGAVVEAWYYWTRGIALSFDEEVDWRLCAIEVTAADAELDGQRPIGMTSEQVRAALAGAEIEWDGDEMEPAGVEAWSLNLWIENDKVTSLQWSVGFDEHDQERWP